MSDVVAQNTYYILRVNAVTFDPFAHIVPTLSPLTYRDYYSPDIEESEKKLYVDISLGEEYFSRKDSNGKITWTLKLKSKRNHNIPIVVDGISEQGKVTKIKIHFDENDQLLILKIVWIRNFK